MLDIHWISEKKIWGRHSLHQMAREEHSGTPNLRTIKPHIQGVSLVIDISISPATDFSLKGQDGNLVPVFYTNALTPEAQFELRLSFCQNSSRTNRCGLRKNLLLCTGASACFNGWENSEDYKKDIDDNEELL